MFGAVFGSEKLLDTYLRGSIYQSDNADITSSSEHNGSENVGTLTDQMLQDIEITSNESELSCSCNFEVYKTEGENILEAGPISIGSYRSTSYNTYDLSRKSKTDENNWIEYPPEKYKSDIRKSKPVAITDEQVNKRTYDIKLFPTDSDSSSYTLLPLEPCSPYQSDGNSESWLHITSDNQGQMSMSNKDRETIAEVAKQFDSTQEDRHTKFSFRRTSSDNNILVETEKAETDHLQTHNSLQRKCSSAESLNAAMTNSQQQQKSQRAGLLKRWYSRLTEKQKPSYRFVKRFSLPCQCSFCDKCSCNIVSAIADAGKGLIWIGFMNSRVIKLCNMKGKVKDSVNVNALVDDIVTSRSGDAYISCPSAKCIKVIYSENPGRVVVFEDFSNYQWYPRGLAVSPVDDTLIACLAPKCMEYPAPVITRSNIMRFETDRKSCKTTLVTTEKCFGYPLRLAINTEDTIIVYDYGFQGITILNNKGLVLAKFSEIDEITISSRLALCFNKYDEAIIVQGRQPTLTELKLDGSPFTTEHHKISELNETNINAAMFSTNDHLFVGTRSGVINIFKKS